MNDELKPFVLCLMGPTAAGKTALALELVQQFPCDIISVDSAMIYKGMDIGTAKPNASELAIAPHRLIDIRDPAETYSAADFCHDATREMNTIIEAGRLPLLVGGTMMYFHALQQGLSPLPAADATIRQQLLLEAEQIGWIAMHDRLKKLDPIAAERIHPNDPQRIQRALEVHEITGQNLTTLQAVVNTSPYHFINFAILPEDRTVLHQRIAQRFEAMLAQGFIAEVEHLYHRGDLTLNMPALRAVGYRQAWDYVAGIIDKTEFQNKGIAATRQLAKRQLTWLRSWPNLNSIYFDRVSALQAIIQQIPL